MSCTKRNCLHLCHIYIINIHTVIQSQIALPGKYMEFSVTKEVGTLLLKTTAILQYRASIETLLTYY